MNPTMRPQAATSAPPAQAGRLTHLARDRALVVVGRTVHPARHGARRRRADRRALPAARPPRRPPLVEHVIDAGRFEPSGCEYRLVDLTGKSRTVTLAVDTLPDGTVTGLVVDVTTSRSRAVADGVNAQLALALESRSVIDQAKGVLMSCFGVDSDAAFACLSLMSQHRNIRLRVIAEEIRSAAASGDGLSGALLTQIDGTLALLAARVSGTPAQRGPRRGAATVSLTIGRSTRTIGSGSPRSGRCDLLLAGTRLPARPTRALSPARPPPARWLGRRGRTAPFR